MTNTELPPLPGETGAKLSEWATKALDSLRTSRSIGAADDVVDFFKVCTALAEEQVDAVLPEVVSASCPYPGRTLLEVRFNSELRGSEVPQGLVTVLGCTVQGAFVYGRCLLVYLDKRCPQYAYVSYTPGSEYKLQTVRGEDIKAFNKAVV